MTKEQITRIQESDEEKINYKAEYLSLKDRASKYTAWKGKY